MLKQDLTHTFNLQLKAASHFSGHQTLKDLLTAAVNLLFTLNTGIVVYKGQRIYSPNPYPNTYHLI